MKRISDSTRLAEFSIKACLIAALGVILLAPMSIKANGTELVQAGHGASMLTHGSQTSLPLPPIADLETMPWLSVPRAKSLLKIDTLLAPKLELAGPALVQSLSSNPQSSPVRRETTFATGLATNG